jgi:hypothetical protein
LFAQQAAINTLQAQLIQILNAIFGGPRFTRSGSTVVDNGADKTGFMLGADGRLTASNAEISGTVNAASSVFNDITISGDSLFQGTINSGPLVLSNETPQGQSFTYAVGTRSDTIYNEASAYLDFSNDSGIEKAYSVTGTYNNTQIIRIGYYWEQHYHGASYDRTIYVYNIDGEKIKIAYRNSDNDYSNTSFLHSQTAYFILSYLFLFVNRFYQGFMRGKIDRYERFTGGLIFFNRTFGLFSLLFRAGNTRQFCRNSPAFGDKPGFRHGQTGD